MRATVAALDVGGTVIKAALVDRAGTVRHETRASTPRGTGVEQALDVIAGHVDLLLVRAETMELPVTGVCVAVPGILDEDTGIVRNAANLGWHGVPAAKELSARLDRPVRVTHDVRAGGLAESRAGAAVGVADCLFVAVGTGISAAAIVDGTMLTAEGLAGEIGHVRVSGARGSCHCGGTGCLETLSSASAIARTYAERTGLPMSGASEVADLVRQGDPMAGDVWSAAVAALGDVLALSAAVLGSRLIVVGGGLSQAGALLVEPLAARVAVNLRGRPAPRVVTATLGDAAGCLGAAMLAWDRVPADAETS
jgi:glucokinase